jgi:hypothetical protein
VQIGLTNMESLVDSWTESRITAACAFVLERLEADFKDTGLTVEFRFDPSWSDPDAEMPIGIHPYHRRPEDAVASSRWGNGNLHEFPLQLDGGVESACWYAADQMQTDVMDEHNQPWPELLDRRGRFVGVLDIPGGGTGLAQWELRGEPFCAVGHLHKSCEAAGLTIKPLSGQHAWS